MRPILHHQRAKLVVLTPQGRVAATAAEERQRPWAREMMAGLTLERLATAREVLSHMNKHLAHAIGAPDEDFTTEEK